MVSVLRVRLNGTSARLGQVLASDVAKLLLSFESAVARAAGRVLQRPVKATGRWEQLVADAARFKLVAIEEGSIAAALELPDRQLEPGTLPGVADNDANSLSRRALDVAFKTAAGELDDPDVAAALLRLITELGIGSRYEAVAFEYQPDDDQPAHRVTLDMNSRERLGHIAGRKLTARADVLYGTLFEANFETMTARLRRPDGSKVDVSFEQAQADAIQQALRSPAEIEGRISYDPHTSHALSVELRSIVRVQQLVLAMETGNFWYHATVEELAAQHGITPVNQPEMLEDHDLTDEELAAFLDALAEPDA